MNVVDADKITLAAFIAAIFIHRHAIYIVLLHLLCDWLYVAIDSPIYYNLALGLAFAFSGAQLINISYKLRQVLLCVGLLFWLSAVDYYLFPVEETLFFKSFAYIVGVMDLYALLLMLRGGGSGGRLYRMCEHWFFFLRYRILCI